jgi:tetratricopeptide (TPR) repeat protein
MSASAAEALALLRAGRAAEAEARLRGAVASGTADAETIHLLGFLLATSGRASEGMPFLDRSIVAAPTNAGFIDNRAQVLLQMGLVDEALRDARAATALAPGYAQAWLHLAQALRRAGNAHESRNAAARAMALDAKSAAAAYHVALIDFEGGHPAAAESGFAHVLERDPGHAAALNNLGILQRRAGRDSEALESFARAVAAEPRNPMALNNLGLSLQHAGKLDDAKQAFERAAYPEALANAAGLALELERLEEARALYGRAAAMKPGLADAEYGLAQVALREQRFAEGWDGYERRFDTHPPLATPRPLAIPRLGAGDLDRARRVAIWSEQGLGDQILFTTLLPELERRGIHAVVEVDPRLLSLYRRSLPFFEFTTRAESERAFEDCDFHLPMGSLPRLFRRTLESFAGQPERLLVAPDAARFVAPAAATRKSAGAQSLIAISWRSLQSGMRKGLAARKSIPLESFAELAQCTGAKLLDVQYGDVDDERREFESKHPGVLTRIEGLDAREDLEGVAAALAACERLVTASNATAHLAGALGIPTRLVAPRGWPPFSYWVPRADGRSTWYPSVTIASTVDG